MQTSPPHARRGHRRGLRRGAGKASTLVRDDSFELYRSTLLLGVVAPRAGGETDQQENDAEWTEKHGRLWVRGRWPTDGPSRPLQ